MAKLVYIFLLVCQFLLGNLSAASRYVISDVSGLGRRYDGIGAISGGGATSRLLVNYSKQYQAQILDYLFKPNFGASLNILKVEIGGDSQSTDGTESSHMHSANDENYQRGYEWWLMKEAKKRNPNMKLYGLPWAFPGWIGNGFHSPYINIDVTVDYIIKWIQGAKLHHNLTIDYIGLWNEKLQNATNIKGVKAGLDEAGLGQVVLVAADAMWAWIWNERPFDVLYIKTLRKSLDQKGLKKTEIVAADNLEFISIAIHNDPEIAKDVAIIGVHYPGTEVTNYTLETGKTIWASEDFSTFNDEVGAGCWARILNQNYVNGMMTSTIAWNLVASYYDALPFKRTALMTANEPWSGHYKVTDPIWITAHTTQFTEPGWTYLKHLSGVQHLDKGGSFVSLTDGQNLTIIIETMSHNNSVCIRPYLPPYTVSSQTATFMLQGTFSKIASLNVWHSKLGFSGEPPTMFERREPIKVSNGQFTLSLAVDEVYTLTTSVGGVKGSYPTPPPSAPFPVPYADNFDNYALYSEASNFADQAGVWEIRESGDPTHGLVMQQVVPQTPVYWCQAAQSPISFVGNYSWKNVNVSVDVKLGNNTGAFLAHRVQKGGCHVTRTTGLFFIVYSNGTFSVYADINRRSLLTSGKVSNVKSESWFNMQLLVQNNKATGKVEGKMTFSVQLDPAKIKDNGFLAIGMPHYASAQFDNFNIAKAD